MEHTVGGKKEKSERPPRYSYIFLHCLLLISETNEPTFRGISSPKTGFCVARHQLRQPTLPFLDCQQNLLIFLVSPQTPLVSMT